MIIGLGHYRRVGKDTFANFLLEECAASGVKAEKGSFAYKMKQICHDLYAWAGLREPEFYETPEGAALREVPLAFGKSPRQIWIDMGQSVRSEVYDSTWLDYLLKKPRDGHLIIPDVRFPNEAEAIRQQGGILIKIVREGFGPGPDVADQALIGYQGWDYVIGGSLASLSDWAHLLALSLKGGYSFYQSNRKEYEAYETFMES
jgi:hypothetical protein